MSIRLFCATSLIACSNVSTIVGQPKKGLRVRTKLRAGGIWENHNETIVGQPKKGLRVNTNLRAGGITLGNHNETIVGQPKKRLRVSTNLRAGGIRLVELVWSNNQAARE